MIERLRVRIPAELLQSQLCVLALIRYPFHPRVTAVAGKRSGHSAKSAGGRLHLNTHTPLTHRSRSGLTIPLSRHSVGNELTRNSSGNTRLQSSQLAEPPWTDLGLKSGISLRELIFTLNNNKKTTTTKKRSRGMNCRTFSPNPRTRGKSHHHHHQSKH